MTTNVVVNLDVLVDATGDIRVFGKSVPTMTNVIVPVIQLPYTDLYKGADNGLLKFKGNVENNYDLIEGVRNTSFTGTQADLAADLKTILNGSFDCSGATPFNIGSYNNVYSTQGSFGNIALSAYSHSLFGHLAATAAIDNDSSFISKMNNDTVADARLNIALASEIFNLSMAKATEVARQVIGQDSSRARSEDNDGSNASDYQALEFRQGDVIYMSIKLVAPVVTVSNVAQASAPSASNYTDTVYNMKITLGPAFTGSRESAPPTGLAPNISYTSPQNLTIGSSVTITPTNSGGSGTYIVPDVIVFDSSGNMSTVPGLPAGLSINASTGVISGYPASTTTITATVQASNGYGISQATINFVVTQGLLPPNVEYTNPLNLVVGQAVTITPTNTGGAVQATNGYSLNFTPGGMTFNRNTGVLSGTPTAASSGTMIISATNASGEDLEYINFTISAAPALAAPSISYTTPQNLVVGNSVTITPTSSGGAVASYSSTTLPAGLTLNTSTGVITGTVTTAMSGSVTVTATNITGTGQATIAFSVAVATPSISYTTPVSFNVGQTISIVPTSSGGPVASYSSTTLPDGLTLNTSTGTISGTLTTAMTGSVTVTATNTSGTGQAIIAFTVTLASPSISYTTPLSIIVDSSANITPINTGGAATYSIAPALPTGLSIDTASGTISGSPYAVTSSNTYTVTSSNTSGTSTFNINLEIARLITNSSMVWTSSIQFNSSITNTTGVAVDTLGNLYVTGDVSATMADVVYNSNMSSSNTVNKLPKNNSRTSDKTCYTFKYNSNGVFQHAMGLNTMPFNSGQCNQHTSSGVCTDMSNNVYTCGRYAREYLTTTYIYNSNMSSSNFNKLAKTDGEFGADVKTYAAYVSKFNSNGSLLGNVGLFAKPTSAGNAWAEGRQVRVNSNGDIFLSGNYRAIDSSNIFSFLDESRTYSNFLPTSIGTTSVNAFLMKFNSAGAFQWASAIAQNTLTSHTMCNNNMEIDNDGNIILVGSYRGISSNIKIFNSNSTSFESSLSNVLPTSSFSSAGHDSYIVKFNTNGQFISAASISGPSSDSSA